MFYTKYKRQKKKKKKLEKIYKIIFAKQTIEIMDNKYQ